MYKAVKKKILKSILRPIAETEGKLEDKADYIFSCLSRNGVVSEEDKHCFIKEFFGHISSISDNMSNALDKAVERALKALNISIEEGDEKD